MVAQFPIGSSSTPFFHSGKYSPDRGAPGVPICNSLPGKGAGLRVKGAHAHAKERPKRHLKTWVDKEKWQPVGESNPSFQVENLAS